MSYTTEQLEDRGWELLRGATDLRSASLNTGQGLQAQLFALPAGSVLPAHEVSTVAVLHFIEGRAGVRVGDDTVAAEEGTWLHVFPDTVHSVEATDPTVFLLTRPLA
jgi:quercetin dioxygenase-like cupin family protein